MWVLYKKKYIRIEKHVYLADLVGTDSSHLPNWNSYLRKGSLVCAFHHTACLAYIIKLLKITVTREIGLLMCAYLFCMYIYMFYIFTKLYLHSPLASSLNLADLLVYIYNASHNNFYNYFLSEYVIFGFWNVEF